MTPSEFLRAVWPDQGIYALATIFTIPGTTTKTYAHKTFTSIDDAAAFVRQADKTDIYFAVHSLREPKVWNPAKTNRKTGELGAYEIRTQSNMLAARAFFFDLDVGVSSEKTQKYPTQADALAGLIDFCRATGLPKPMVVSSGSGVHVYWLVDTSLPSDDWKQHAAKLRQLAKHHGLLADPARTTDTASVLRVAGTRNFKNPANPKPVQVLVPSTPLPLEKFLKLVDTAVTRAGVTVKPLPIHTDFGSNLDEDFGPPVSMKAILIACGQMRRLAQLKGNVTEPEWYHSINLVRFVENGRKFVHKISEGHPQYSYDETEKKVTQLEQKGIKPTSCVKLAEVCGDDYCAGCPFVNRVKSPIVAARMKDEAPAPVIQTQVRSTAQAFTIPDPPRPFARLKAGGIAKTSKNKDGDEITQVIYPHDLYPLRRVVNSAAEVEQQVWRAILPRSGAKDFSLDADALYDRRKFATAITHQGIYPQNAHIQDLQDYMIAYIAELQKEADAEAQCNHLGWTDEYRQFILPDKVLLDDGTAKNVSLSLGAARASAQVHKKGSLQRQVELMQFYNHRAYRPNQFYILGGLAAPIFYMTGHHGVIMNASGEAGASKSTSLYTAASFWGQPELYPINGTNNGATVRGRNERVTTLANLPICVDEITHMPVKDAIDLAMSITQPGHRIRLTTEGIERSALDSHKATIMLATANNSLHGLLSIDNSAGTAGSMRVFEIRFKKSLVHQKHEADDFAHELRQNYGHIGEEFVAYVLKNRELIAARVRETMREIDIEGKIEASERFWSATVATVLVAGEVAREMGLLPFDVAELRDWVLTEQLPAMRGVVQAEYNTPVGILADFLESINSNMIVIDRQTAGNLTPYAVRAPTGPLLAHYDLHEQLLYVLKKSFKDYCVRTGANFNKILDDLSEWQVDATGRKIRIISQRQARKILGSGTPYAKAQSWCFIINMKHPEITGVVDLGVAADNPTVSTTPARGEFRLV